jgi:hypothetical protein
MNQADTPCAQPSSSSRTAGFVNTLIGTLLELRKHLSLCTEIQIWIGEVIYDGLPVIF